MMTERGIDLANTTILRWVQHYSRNSQNAGKAFLCRPISCQRMPTKITLDAYAASHRAVADLKESDELPRRVRVRSNKYVIVSKNRTTGE